MLLCGVVAAEGVLKLLDLYPRGPRYLSLQSDGPGTLTFTLRSNGRPPHSVTVKVDPEPGTRRVVMVGGSSIYGAHLRPTSTVAKLLQRRLHERLGGSWEVVNLGAPGFAAEHVHRVAEKAMEELRPEYLVVHTGHEEFLLENSAAFVDRVQRPVLSRLLVPFGFTRVGRGLKFALIDSRRLDYSTLVANDEGTVLEHSALARARGLVLNHYENQLTEIVEKSIQADVKLVLIQPTSNTREFGPVASAFTRSLDAQQRKTYRRMLDKASRLLEAGDDAGCALKLNQLAGIDPGVAVFLHLKAALAWRSGDAPQGRQLDLRGLSFDEHALAASEALLQRLHSVADHYAQEITLAAPHMERIPAASEPPIFLDQVHPTVYGQYLMACLLAASIDPVRKNALEPFPEGLKERQVDFRRTCKRLKITSNFVEKAKFIRIRRFVEHSAIALVMEPCRARARELLSTVSAETIRDPELLEPLLVLAILELDREEVLRRERDLKEWKPVRHQRLLTRVWAHPRLRGFLLAMGLRFRGEGLIAP